MYGYKTYRFYLDISKEQLLRVYTGSARNLIVTTDRGIVLQLDAQHLTKFTTKEGVHGRFVLKTTSTNKFISLTQED